MMFNVYYMLPKQHPVLVAEFEGKQYAQILADTGNKLYTDGREYWVEEVIEEEEPEYQHGYEKKTDVDKWVFVPYETRY